MPTNLADVMSALEQLLLDHFKGINSGSATQPFLAFELGTPIPDQLFRNPADTTVYSPALALEYMSHRSNAVASIQQRLFVETGKTVDGLYEVLLRGSMPVDAASMELLGSIKTGAAAAFDDLIRAEGGISEQFRPTHGDPENWYDQSVKENWTSMQVSHADQPPATLVAQPVHFDQQLLQWNLATPEARPQLGNAVSQASLSAINSERIRAVAVAPAMHLAPHASQTAAFSLAATPGLFLHMSPVQAASSQRHAGQVTAVNMTGRFGGIGATIGAAAGGHAVVPTPAPPVPVPPAPPVQPPVTSDAFSISVDVSIVKLRRPWLSDGLLSLTNWFVPSAVRGSFSGGKGADDIGILPVLSVACVLIRNLSIHAQWSDDDQKNLENATHLGAFGLQGRSYDRNSATLTVPGMQSVAWVCDPLPILPPADTPVVPPAATPVAPSADGPVVPPAATPAS